MTSASQSLPSSCLKLYKMGNGPVDPIAFAGFLSLVSFIEFSSLHVPSSSREECLRSEDITIQQATYSYFASLSVLVFLCFPVCVCMYRCVHGCAYPCVHTYGTETSKSNLVIILQVSSSGSTHLFPSVEIADRQPCLWFLYGGSGGWTHVLTFAGYNNHSKSFLPFSLYPYLPLSPPFLPKFLPIIF